VKLRIKMFTRLLFFLGGGFFQRSTAKAPEPIFTRNMSNDTVPRKDVPFRGYENKNKNLTFTPRNSRKTAIFTARF